MGIPDYHADAEFIQQNPDARKALAEAIRDNYPAIDSFPKMGKSRQRVLWWQLRPFAEELDISLTDDPKGGRDEVNDDIKSIAPGNAKGRMPLYLAWLWAYHEDAARSLYDQIKLDHSPYIGAVPELDDRGRPVIDIERPGGRRRLGKKAANSSWSRFFNAYASFTRLEILPITDEGLSLIDFSEREPAAEPLSLGQDFCFRFDAPHEGDLIAFQRYKRVWYLLPLLPDAFHISVRPGKQIVPVDPEAGTPLPMSESETPGTYGFAFLLAASGQVNVLSDQLQPEERLPLRLLPMAERILATLPIMSRRVYRINVKIDE